MFGLMITSLPQFAQLNLLIFQFAYIRFDDNESVAICLNLLIFNLLIFNFMMTSLLQFA